MGRSLVVKSSMMSTEPGIQVVVLATDGCDRASHAVTEGQIAMPAVNNLLTTRLSYLPRTEVLAREGDDSRRFKGFRFKHSFQLS